MLWPPIFSPKLLKTCTCVAFLFKNHMAQKSHQIETIWIFPKIPNLKQKYCPWWCHPSRHVTHHVVWCHSRNISHHMMSFTLWIFFSIFIFSKKISLNHFISNMKWCDDMFSHKHQLVQIFFDLSPNHCPPIDKMNGTS
jgi:hypothetical protein